MNIGIYFNLLTEPIIVKVGLVDGRTPENSQLEPGKPRLKTIEFPKGSGIGSILDVGVEGEAKITFSPPPPED